MDEMIGKWKRPETPVMFFFIVRLILFLSLPISGIRSYGDFWNFYNLASLGRPFRDLWVEFPPLFPHFSRLIYLMVEGRQASYEYLFAFLLTLVQGGNILLVWKIARKLYDRESAANRTWIYAFGLVGLFYGWTYFDPLAVLFTLLGIYFLLLGQEIGAGAAIALGILTKWFSALLLPAAWKSRSLKRFLAAAGIVLLLVGGVWGALFIQDAHMTRASLLSQGVKGSWESIWALLDGNIKTGNFGASIDHRDPASILAVHTKPAVVPPWLSLIILGGWGLAILLKTKIEEPAQMLGASGFTMVVFFLWSPGYSPQWILYILPFIFLLFPMRESILFGLAMILIHLLEWPLLLSRGMFWSLWGVVPLRTMLVILAGVRFFQVMKGRMPMQTRAHQNTDSHQEG